VTVFSIMDVGRTGVGFSRYWMDTIAHNLANVNTIAPAGEEPFRARLVVAQALGRAPFAPNGSGVGVAAVREDASAPARSHDPGNPLADADGIVTLPVVDLAGQMADLILANRSYQMNLKTVETGREAYQAALRLGQR
jgi:flagellar basal-body rod protein FlgC